MKHNKHVFVNSLKMNKWVTEKLSLNKKTLKQNSLSTDIFMCID